MTTVTIQYHGTEGETWTRMDQVAQERGYDPGCKHDFSAIWPRQQPGVDMYESWFYRTTGNSRDILHVLCENSRVKQEREKASKLISANND